MYSLSLVKPSGTGVHVAESIYFFIVDCGFAWLAWTYPCTSIKTRPSLSGGCENSNRSQRTTTPMTLSGLLSPVRAPRFSLRSFSFSTAVVSWQKSAFTINWKLQSQITVPFSHFLLLLLELELDQPASDWGAIETQSLSLSGVAGDLVWKRRIFKFQILTCGHRLKIFMKTTLNLKMPKRNLGLEIWHETLIDVLFELRS